MLLPNTKNRIFGYDNPKLSLVFFELIVPLYLICYRIAYGRYNLLCRPHVFTLLQSMIAKFIGCKVIYEMNGVAELEYKSKGLPAWICAYFKFAVRWNAIFAEPTFTGKLVRFKFPVVLHSHLYDLLLRNDGDLVPMPQSIWRKF